MTEDEALLHKQEALKRQLAALEHNTLADKILIGPGRLIQKITHRPEPPALWYNALVIVLVTLLTGSLVSLALGETPTVEMMLIATWAAIMGVLVMVQTHSGSYLILSTLRESTVEACVSIANLEQLQHWLTATFDRQKQVVFSVILALIVGLSTPLFWSTLRGGFPGFGPIVGVILIWFQAGTGWYFIFPLMGWFNQLGSYHLKLYGADPSSSEIVDRLSDMLSYLVYSSAVLGALFTLGLIYFELLTPSISVIFLALGTWAPLIITFATGQYTLARLISKAKWKTLNEIQTQIEQLRHEEAIPSEQTLGHLDKLMDYHDRIKATRNTALDLRAGLSFLNSLLLPLLAFIIANLDQIIAYFS